MTLYDIKTQVCPIYDLCTFLDMCYPFNKAITIEKNYSLLYKLTVRFFFPQKTGQNDQNVLLFALLFFLKGKNNIGLSYIKTCMSSECFSFVSNFAGFLKINK